MGEWIKKIMENQKAQFFAQYLYTDTIVVPAFMSKDASKRCKTTTLTTGVLDAMIETQSYLQLRSLSSISDEDAIEVARLLTFHDGDGALVFAQNDRISVYDKYEDEPHKKNVLHIFFESLEVFSLDENGKVFQYDCERLLSIADYLRSKGYALPYLNYSVEQLVQMGWIKLVS